MDKTIENNETMSPLIENHHVFTTTHELLVDGHHLIEKKQKTLSHADGIEKTLVLLHVRTIDDKSYKVTETNYNGVPKSQVETEMTEDEVNQFEEDWTSLWNPKMKLRNFTINSKIISLDIGNIHKLVYFFLSKCMT